MFSDNLKAIRQSHGLSQAQMASDLGISPSTVGMYEQGRRTPDSNMLKKICSLYNVSMDYLLDVSVEDKNKEKSVDEFIDEVTYTLKSAKGLMFNGRPITNEDKEKISIAIKIATAVAVYGDSKPLDR